MTGFPYAVPQPLLGAIASSEVVLLATHEHPDADGLGSLLAFALAMSDRGRTVKRLTNGPVPAPLSELPGLDRIEVWSDGDRNTIADLVVLFDCHRRTRLGDAAASLKRMPFVAAIDHHPVDPRGSDVDCLWLVEDAPATAMMVQSLLHHLGGPALSAAAASNLYAGLLTDTGGFRHSNTTRSALTAAAELVARGADAAELAELLLHRRRPQALQLFAEVLLGTQYRLGGRVAVMAVDQAMLERTGARLEESESLASQLTSIEDVVYGALLREVGPHSWRVSLRTNGPGRVDRVAQGFGGGGHRRAAAYTVEGPRDEVEATLVAALADALEGPPTGGQK